MSDVHTVRALLANHRDPRSLQDLIDDRRLQEGNPFRSRVQRIAGRLLDSMSATFDILVIEASDPFLAFCVGEQVVIGSALDRLHDAELAFVIAHELGHVWFGDQPRPVALDDGLRRRSGSVAAELRADDFARRFTTESGYPDGSVRFLERVVGRDAGARLRDVRVDRPRVLSSFFSVLTALTERWSPTRPSAQARLDRALEAVACPSSETVTPCRTAARTWQVPTISPRRDHEDTTACDRGSEPLSIRTRCTRVHARSSDALLRWMLRCEDTRLSPKCTAATVIEETADH